MLKKGYAEEMKLAKNYLEVLREVTNKSPSHT